MDHLITVSIPENRLDLICLASIKHPEILSTVICNTDANFVTILSDDPDRITPGKISCKGFDPGWQQAFAVLKGLNSS